MTLVLGHGGKPERIWLGEHWTCGVVGGVGSCVGWSAPGALSVKNNRESLVAAKQIVSGRTHICVLDDAGKVRCQGLAPVGDGRRCENGCDFTEVPSIDATSLAANTGNTCAVLRSGSVVCWGLYTAMGFDLTPTPTAIAGLSNVRAIELAGRYGCALARDGSVVCGGPEALNAVNLEGPAEEIALSDLTACARFADGRVVCWGARADNAGQLVASAPAVVPLAGKAVQLAGGEDVCARLENGMVQCENHGTVRTVNLSP